MAKNDIEQAYDAALGYCIDAMYSLRRFSGDEAIESFQSAIRAIERGKRAAVKKHRQEMARPIAAYVVEPLAAPPTSSAGPYPGCHHPEKCNVTGRCPRDPVCFN